MKINQSDFKMNTGSRRHAREKMRLIRSLASYWFGKWHEIFQPITDWSNHEITFYKWLKQNTVLDCVPVPLRVTYGKWGTAVLTFESVPDEPLTWFLRWNHFRIAAPSYHVIAGIQFNPLSPKSAGAPNEDIVQNHLS